MPFCVGRSPPQGTLVGTVDGVGQVAPRGLERALGEPVGLTLDEAVVHERERLERRDRLATRRRLHGGTRAIEGVEERFLPRVDIHPVDGAPVELGIVAVDGVIEGGVEVRGREGAEARTPHRGIEFPTHREHRVAHRLGFEAPWRITPEEDRVGIDCRRLLVVIRGLSVGRGKEDGAVEGLEPPSPAHQFPSQPVEELRVARPATVEAEIARCRHEPTAEVILPDPVGDHAGREGIGRSGDPGCEPPPPLRFGGLWYEPQIGVDSGDGREPGRRHDRTGGRDAPTEEERRWRWLDTDADIRHFRGGGGRLGLLLEFIDPRRGPGVAAPLGIVEAGEDLLLRDGEAPGPEGGDHLLVAEGPVVKRSLENLAVEKAVAGAVVPQPEKDRRRPLLKRPQRRRGDIRGGVTLAVAVERDAVVGAVDRRHVDRLTGRRRLLRRLEVVRPGEAAAAGDPFPRLPLAKHDRVEISVRCAFDRDRRPSPLIEVRQHDPNLERFFPYGLGDRITFEGGLASPVEPEPSPDDLGSSMELAAGRCTAILERPADQGRRAGGRRDAIL